MGKFDKDSLGNRQKSYEHASKSWLVPREPVILRVDGRAFHTFTRGMSKPFDQVLGRTMKRVMQALCEEIQNCVFGYTQSDEITLVLAIRDRVKTQPYLAGSIQKAVSLTASKATRYFNLFFREEDTQGIYTKKYDLAEFDCRAFNIPEWDVINNLIWRQQDAVRNSIESAAQAVFSSTQIYKKNCSELQDMMLIEKGINWNNYSPYEKQGACCYRVEASETISYTLKHTGETIAQEVTRRKWTVDENMPIITQNRMWFSDITGMKED